MESVFYQAPWGDSDTVGQRSNRELVKYSNIVGLVQFSF